MTVSNDISVIIADDHPLFRDGVREALSKEGDIRVRAVAADGAEALRAVLEHAPDIAVLDMNMPKMTGLQVLKELHRTGSATGVVFLTMFDDDDILNEAMDLGVKAYLLKESAAVEIVQAVRAAVEGRYYLSPSLTGKILARKERLNAFSSKHPGIERLTESERRVLRMIAESRTSKEIAETLFLSQKTVDNYRFKISEKLALSGSYSLLKFAIENRSLL